VDRARLVAAARRTDSLFELTAPIGSYGAEGTPILLSRGEARIDRSALRGALLFADGRRLPQDPALGIRCIVDVVARVLSPAINDPTSAVEGLDALETVLVRLGHRQLDGSAILDEEGMVRLVVPLPGWNELVELALTEVRWYGADTPQVARRLTALLDHLGEVLPPERQAALARQREALERSLQRIYAAPDDLRFAMTADPIGIGGVSSTAQARAHLGESEQSRP